MKTNEFKPKRGQVYWYLNYVMMYDKFIPDESVWQGDQWEQGALDKGLIFETSANAQEMCDRYNQAIHNVNK